MENNNKPGGWESILENAGPGIGILMLDASDRLICGNQEAIDLLTYPDKSLETAAVDALVREYGADRPGSREFVSGKRRYRCRSISLIGTLSEPRRKKAIVFFRGSQKATIDMTRVAENFSLTEREGETIRLLLDGHSNSGIAARMDISPNTVKVFMKLAMIKMKVSSRVAIIAKTLKFAGVM